MQSYQKNKGSRNEDIELQFVGIWFHNIKKCLYYSSEARITRYDTSKKM